MRLKIAQLIRRAKCWWKHDWVFTGGEWVIPEKVAITKRTCWRCGLYQEIQQNHDRFQAYFFGSQELHKEGQREPGTGDKYGWKTAK